MSFRPAPLPAPSVLLGAVLIAVIAVTGLAGCGRKGGLDPPPVAPPVDQRGAVMQPPVAPDGVATGQAPPPPPPARTAAWLDWLIN